MILQQERSGSKSRFCPSAEEAPQQGFPPEFAIHVDLVFPWRHPYRNPQIPPYDPGEKESGGDSMDKASTEFECKERMSSSVSRMLEALPSRLLDEMGSILRRYNLLPSRGIEACVSFIPQVDIIEDDQSIRVDAELPGVDEKDIDITLTPDTLTISGEKKEEYKHRAEDLCCTERSFGSFSRTIPLPDSVDVNMAEAVYENGVLSVSLPKLEGEMTARKIPISHAGV